MPSPGTETANVAGCSLDAQHDGVELGANDVEILWLGGIRGIFGSRFLYRDAGACRRLVPDLLSRSV